MRQAALATVAVAAVALAGCTPDVTRQRLEADIAISYSHQLDLFRTYRGKPAAHLRPGAECHRSGQHRGDQGPGSWSCRMTYRDPDTGRPAAVREIVPVGGDTCYQALNPDFSGRPTLRDARTRRTVPNPLFQFDGCLNVFDRNTSTQR